jgi:hypothetical protein
MACLARAARKIYGTIHPARAAKIVRPDTGQWLVTKITHTKAFQRSIAREPLRRQEANL